MRILILGAGGVGGLFGGRLIQAGADVTFLVRDARKSLMEKQGLVIESQFGDAKIKPKLLTQSELTASFDLILFACKAYDLEGSVEAISNGVGKETAILPILNGIEHIEILNRRFGKTQVLGGVAKVQATLTPDGIVRQLNDWQTITFGEQDGSISSRVKELKSLFDKTPIEAKLSESIIKDMWLKLVHLSTVAGATCLMRANIGEIVRTPEGNGFLMRLFERNVKIAAAEGHVPDDSFIKTYAALFSDKASLYEASMLRDLEKGGRIEADHILGYMLRACRKAGVIDDLHLAAFTHAKAYEVRRDAGRLAS